MAKNGIILLIFFNLLYVVGINVVMFMQSLILHMD